MKYYSILRPVSPGTFPKPTGNKILEIRNFDDKTYIPEIDREAWGYIDYSAPLTEQEISVYELVEGVR